MKYRAGVGLIPARRSLPMRGEWIEISGFWALVQSRMSLPMRGEWIEIVCRYETGQRTPSLPMRGEWIEISYLIFEWNALNVSPHAGRVD